MKDAGSRLSRSLRWKAILIAMCVLNVVLHCTQVPAESMFLEETCNYNFRKVALLNGESVSVGTELARALGYQSLISLSVRSLVATDNLIH